MNFTDKFLKNTIILSICSIINKAMFFIAISFFSRWLTVEDFGIYDVLTTYSVILLPIVTLSVSNAIFRLSLDEDNYKYRKIYISNGACIFICGFIIFSIFAMMLFEVLKLEYTFSFIYFFTSQLLDTFCQSVLRALKKLEIYAIGSTISGFITLIFVNLFVQKLNMGLHGIILGYGTGYLCGTFYIFSFIKIWEYVDFKQVSLKKLKEMILYSLPLIPNEIAWWIINVSDRSIVNYFLGASANGIYAIACKIPNLCTSFFGVFNISWQESASEAISNEEREKYFNHIHKNMIKVLLSICICVLACNFLLFDFVFDSRYLEARKYTAILISSTIFNMTSQFYGGIQIALKKPKINGISTMIGSVINIVVHFCFISYIGLYAAAISTLIANLTVLLIRRKKLNFKFRLEKNHFILIGLYILFVINSMMEVKLIISIIYLWGAILLFFVVNHSIIRKVIGKLFR